MKDIYIYFFFISMGLYFLAVPLSIAGVMINKESCVLKKQNTLFLYVSGSAFLSHTIYLVLRGILSGHSPLANMHETLTFFAWCLAGVNLAGHIQYRKPIISALNYIVILILTVIAFSSSYELTPLYPVLQTIWFELHVSSAFVAYALFTVSCVSAISALIYFKSEDFTLFDEMSEKCARWGLFIFSVSTVTGGIWAFLAWSDYWIWTPKEIWTVILWLYYGTYLHLRLRKWWRGKPINVFAALGIVVMLFTYLGVSVMMQSSHNM